MTFILKVAAVFLVILAAATVTFTFYLASTIVQASSNILEVSSK